MRTGKGTVLETYFDGIAAARIACPDRLIPGPGQYLLADADSEYAATLPVPVFMAGLTDGGFFAASPIPKTWIPGTPLNLRGPLGIGFKLPPASRAVGLAAFGETTNRLGALIEPAVTQGAAVTLLCGQPPQGLPNDLEIMPLESLSEVVKWADYMAFDIPRERISFLLERLDPSGFHIEAQILITAPMPCGGRGDCSVCAVTVKRGYKLICNDGPVFNLKHFL